MSSILRGLVNNIKKEDVTEDVGDERRGSDRVTKSDEVTLNTKSRKVANSLLGDMLSTIEETSTQPKTIKQKPLEPEPPTTKDKENTKDKTGEILGNVFARLGTAEEKQNEVGNRMRKLFNIHLPILTGYLNKEFVYVPEPFVFLYSNEIIYYGEELTRVPVGNQVAELMLGILGDILGFNNIDIYVHNNKQMSPKYKHIIGHQMYELRCLYVQNVLDYHTKTFKIPTDLAVKTKEKILETSKLSFLPGTLVKSSVYGNYKEIKKQVGNNFNVSTKSFNFPLVVSLSVADRMIQYDFNITTEETDLEMETYAQKLERYQMYGESKSLDRPEMTKGSIRNGDNQKQQGKHNNDNNRDNGEPTQDNLQQILKDRITEFNGKLEGNFSLEDGNIVSATYLTVDKEINHEWKTRLREWVNYYKPKKVNSYMTPNKKLLYTGMILSSPTEVKGARDLKGVCIYIDTSTSIDLEKINHAVTTLKSILEGYKGDVKLKTFTTEVKESKITLNSMRTGRIRLNLGGGTDIKAVLQDIQKGRLQDYINIIITDGELDWSVVEGMKRNNYKLAFLITKPINTDNLPKGRNIKIYEVT